MGPGEGSKPRKSVSDLRSPCSSTCQRQISCTHKSSTRHGQACLFIFRLVCSQSDATLGQIGDLLCAEICCLQYIAKPCAQSTAVERVIRVKLRWIYSCECILRYNYAHVSSTYLGMYQAAMYDKLPTIQPRLWYTLLCCTLLVGHSQVGEHAE